MSKISPITINQIGDYLLQKKIGSGGFAKVYLGIHIPTNEKVAIKVIDKTKVKKDKLYLKRIQNEISILKIVKHKNIIKLYEIIESPQKIYLIMEYCEKGELFDYIVSHKKLSEKQSNLFFQEIIDSLQYLHSQNITHRDIKPENMLLTEISNKNKQLSIKLIDFGVSTKYEKNILLKTPCGTTTYAPPEMHKGQKYYGLLSDIWSSGVVLYAMIYGYLPFCDDDNEININNIITGNYELDNHASENVRYLIKGCLNVNVIERFDIEMIKRNKWFNSFENFKESKGIIVGVNKIPIDKDVVKNCVQFGFEEKNIEKSIKENLFDRNYAIYSILLRKKEKDGFESVGDLRSEKFLQFINDERNLVKYNKDDFLKFNYHLYNRNKYPIRKINSEKGNNFKKYEVFNNSEGKIYKIKGNFSFGNHFKKNKCNTIDYKFHNNNIDSIHNNNSSIDFKNEGKENEKNKNEKYNKKISDNLSKCHNYFKKKILNFLELKTSFIDDNIKKGRKTFYIPKKKKKHLSNSFEQYCSNKEMVNLKKKIFNAKDIKLNLIKKNQNSLNSLNPIIKEKGHTIIHNRNASMQNNLRNKNKFIVNTEKDKENSLTPTQIMLNTKFQLNNHKILQYKKKKIKKYLSLNDKSKYSNNSKYLNQSYIIPKRKNNGCKMLTSQSSYIDKKKLKMNLKTNFIENNKDKNNIKNPNNNFNLVNLAKFTFNYLNKLNKKIDENKINNLKKDIKKFYIKNNSLISYFTENKPKIYKGPIDIRCIFFSNLNEMIEKLEKNLNKNKISFSKINQFKYYCFKNSDIFELEIFSIDNNNEKKQIYYISFFSKQGNIKLNNKFIDILFPIR